MTIWWFYLIVALIVSIGLAFIWLAIALNGGPKKTRLGDFDKNIDEAAKKDVERIFSDEFREELRNRGRLHFEKIITENAEFLQQDLRLTSSQLNEYMKTELTNKVHEELDKYEQSVNDARDQAIDAVKKTSLALDEQRKVLVEQVQREIDFEKAKIVKALETQLNDIVSHYLIAAIGNEISLDDQLEYILADFEANKQAMIEDIKNAG